MDHRRGLLPVPRTRISPNLNIEGEEMTSTRYREPFAYDTEHRRRIADLELPVDISHADFERHVRTIDAASSIVIAAAAAKIPARSAPSELERDARGDRLHGPLAKLANKTLGWLR
jgi:hypothetical protein